VGPIAEVVGLKGAPYTFVSSVATFVQLPLIAIVLGCMRWKSAQAHEVRTVKKDDRRTATIKYQEETTMPHCSDSLRSDRAARCAVCDGKFGLVRYY
jgi:hypothetical protein